MNTESLKETEGDNIVNGKPHGVVKTFSRPEESG